MSAGFRIRLFLDSNVLAAGMLAPWGLDKAVLSLCAARVCRLILARVVRDEVEDALLARLAKLNRDSAEHALADYLRLLKLTAPEIVPYPSSAEVAAARGLIRHQADVPVLVSAIASRPDWFLTHNTKHFTPVVARRTGLRIATPVEFFRALARSVG